jgi:hypothetical protein
LANDHGLANPLQKHRARDAQIHLPSHPAHLA